MPGETELATAERVLAGRVSLSKSGTMARALEQAPEDDEPVTEEQAGAIEEEERDAAAGRVVTVAEARSRLDSRELRRPVILP